MKLVVLSFAALAAMVSSPAASQGLATHSVHLVCKLDPGGDPRTVHYSPIGKATIPWLPKGSSYPNTGMIIASAFRDVMVDRQVKFYKAECYAADSVEAVRRRIDRFAWNGEERLEMPDEAFWSALTAWMLEAHRIHGATRDLYRFEPIESVSKGMKRSTLL